MNLNRALSGQAGGGLSGNLAPGFLMYQATKARRIFGRFPAPACFANIFQSSSSIENSARNMRCLSCSGCFSVM